MLTPPPALLQDLNAARVMVSRLQGELTQRDAQLRERDARLSEFDAWRLQSDARLLDIDVRLAGKDREIAFKQAVIDKLTHELATLKRIQYGKKSEQLSGAQATLWQETSAADLAAIEVELTGLRGAVSQPDPERNVPRRMRLPENLPRVEIRHDPDSTDCACGCQMKHIGDDVSEKLDYAPGAFTVERHIRPKWVCGHCETVRMAPMPAQVIDKGIATAGLLAFILVSKFADHLPLYRLEGILGRAGAAIPQSTLGEWVGVCGVRLMPLVQALKQEILTQQILHADETTIRMLDPGAGKTKTCYLWAYTPTQYSDLKAVVYDFTLSRAGANCREFLGDWTGGLLTDDYSGYKALYRGGITEYGCMAHARRKFFDLHANHKSHIAKEALESFGALYGVEREAKDLPPDQRLRLRQEKAQPLADTLRQWLISQRQLVPDGSGTAKAIDYSLNRWVALTRYLDDGNVPIDNNWAENQVRGWAVGRKNWLFAGSPRAGERAAAIMSLIVSARLNGHDPYAYLKDVLTRLPTQKNSQIAELLPHRWQAASAARANA